MKYNKKRIDNLLFYLGSIYRYKDEILNSIGPYLFTHLSTTPLIVIMSELGYDDNAVKDVELKEFGKELITLIENCVKEEKAHSEIIKTLQSAANSFGLSTSPRIIKEGELLEAVLIMIWMFGCSKQLLQKEIPMDKLDAIEGDLLIFAYEELFEYQSGINIWNNIKEDFRNQIELLKEEEVEPDECANNLRNLVLAVR